MNNQAANLPSTQEHLPIAGIQDGVVIMKDGSVRIILQVDPINFELKSEEEQNASIYGYQSFLNSLEYPIQIIIQSKKLDLERYLKKMEASQKLINNDLLRIQIEDYIGFVRQLITIANIMSKKFYVVLSYGSGSIKSVGGGLAGLFGQKAETTTLDQQTFAKYVAEINNRASVTGNGLMRLGLKINLLNTQQLIELFYTVYNPDIATEERLFDLDMVEGGIIQSNMPEQTPEQFQEQITQQAENQTQIQDQPTSNLPQ